MFGSSRPELFYKKGVLKNFIKFTGKHLCQSLFFNKVAGLRPQACNFIRPATLLIKRLWHGCFPVNFTKFLKTLFFIEHLRWLLLNVLILLSSYVTFVMVSSLKGLQVLCSRYFQVLEICLSIVHI